MVRRKIEKTSAIALSAFIIIASLSLSPDWHAVGIFPMCPFPNRIIYPFFHASFIHAALNAWCLLSLVFLFDIRWPRILFAFAVAAAAPICVLSSTPTVGLSSVCYALIGSVALSVRRKLFFNASILVYIAIGFFFPLFNTLIHIYCYLAGLILALFTTPFPCRKK